MDHNQHPSQNARKWTLREPATLFITYQTSLTRSLLEMLMKCTEGTHSIMNEMPG